MPGQAFFLAPGITNADVSEPLTFDDKVRILEASVRGWQLEIAASMLEGSAGNPPIPHSGFAALSVVCSYPEMIWQFQNGESSNGRSQEAFREGLASIFGSVDLLDNVWVEATKNVYSEVRCGLYHAGRTRSRVVLSADFNPAISVDGHDGLIRINPHLLVPAFIEHFANFVAQLRNSGEGSPEGLNFTTAFDRHWGDGGTGALAPTP